MGRTPKLSVCCYCQQPIQTADAKKIYDGQKYHADCYKEYVDKLYYQSKQKEDAQQELCEYICKLFNIKELTPLLKSQIHRMTKENNFTYDGIFYTLKYFCEIKDNRLNEDTGIGIVPYIYSEAKSFYEQRAKLYKKVENLSIEKKDQTVKISTSKKHKEYLIDLERL